MKNTSEDPCHSNLFINSTESPLISAIMFGAGIFGNVAALVILEIRRRRQTRNVGTSQRSLFHVLITVLVLTDLAGTCLVSPLVQLAYSTNTTMVGMSPKTESVCSYFGVSMTFFSLATLSLLFMMALERCFAIGYPYLYTRHVTKKCAYITIPSVFMLCIAFCLAPFAGFGKYVQYCPGTWCFIDMNPKALKDGLYAILYATIMLLLVLVTVVCNGFVVFQLFKMYQRRKRNCGSMVGSIRSNNDRRVMSMAEEVEHLILLVFMTIIFIICTLPLVIRVYINSKFHSDIHSLDLIALRFISINSIIDPWVFILLSPSVLHFFWASVCRAPMGSSRSSMFKTTFSQQKTTNIELSRTALDYTDHFQTVENL